MPSPSRILIYGTDPTLLDTRRMVLEHSGYDVTVALDFETLCGLLAARAFDVLILCHSLSSSECESALALTHSRDFGIKNLILSTEFSTCVGAAEDKSLSALAGPRAILAAVGQLVGEGTSAFEEGSKAV